MSRLFACALCLVLCGCCQRAAPAVEPAPIADPEPPCDQGKIRSIARKYIPTTTSTTVHPLEAEMALKTMDAEFQLMTVKMRPYPWRMCWAKIELEVDLARIAAAKARGELK